MNQPETNRIIVPFAADLNRVRMIVTALYQSKAYEKTVSSKDIHDATGVHERVVYGVSKFLRTLNIIEDDSKAQQYKLSTKGKELGESLIYKDENKEKEIWKSVLDDKFGELVNFCQLRKTNNTLSYKDLFQHIAQVGNISVTDANLKKGLETIIEILVFGEILDNSYLPTNNEVQIEKSSSTKSKKFELPTRTGKEWIEKFFRTLNAKKPEKIEKLFIIGNIVGSGNEFKVLKLVKFLEIADADGNRAKNYEKLNCYGEDGFAKNLKEVLEEKYDSIFKTIDINNCTFENLVNLTSKSYDVDKENAQMAMSVFSSLCEMAGITIKGVEPIKSTSKTESTKRSVERSVQTVNNTPQSIQSSYTSPQFQNVIQERLGVDIKINIEGKDKESFTNTIDFLRQLSGMSKGAFKLNVSKELENIQDDENGSVQQSSQ